MIFARYNTVKSTADFKHTKKLRLVKRSKKVHRRVYALTLNRYMRKIGDKIIAAFITLFCQSHHFLAYIKAVKFAAVCIIISLAAAYIKHRAAHSLAYCSFKTFVISLRKKRMPCVGGGSAVADFVAAFLRHKQIDITIP